MSINPRKLRSPRHPIGFGHVLVTGQAGYQLTGNPIYAWYVIWWCMANRHRLPAWVRDYLQRAGAEIIDLSRDTKRTPQAKKTAAIKALGFEKRGRGGNVFESYTEHRKQLQRYETIQILKAFGVVKKTEEVVAQLRATNRSSRSTEFSRLKSAARMSAAMMRLSKKSG